MTPSSETMVVAMSFLMSDSLGVVHLHDERAWPSRHEPLAQQCQADFLHFQPTNLYPG
jgi:hypothetical protein